MLSASLIACRCPLATRSSSAATRCTRACPSRRAHGTSSRISSEGGRCRSHQLWPRSSGTSSRVSSTSARLWKLSVHSTAPSQARHPLPNCMLSASLSSQARCPHFVWSGQRACKCSAWRPHPSLHRHVAHSVWSGQRACKCSARRPYPTPLFTGTLPTPFGAGSNDFPSPHLGMNRERLCRAYGGVRGEADCL